MDNGLLGGFGRRLRAGREDGEHGMGRREGTVEHFLSCFLHLLRGPGDALLQALGGEPHFDLFLRVLGSSCEPGQLSVGGVREFVKGGDQCQVVI